MRRTVLCLFLAIFGGVRSQKGSKYRCRDRDPQCASWAGRGECTNNHGFMAESCPAACEFCENGGLKPSPAIFQLDLVCKGKLSQKEGTSFKGVPDELPEGCAFQCRDNMTSCAEDAAAGKCDTHAATMRFQCPASCGICKVLELPSAAADAYPKYACREEVGDSEAHKAECPNWASRGECLSNFGFMSVSCEASCGLCAMDGEKPQPYMKILKPPAPKATGSTKKKKKKKAKSTAQGEAAAMPKTADASDSAPKEDKAASKEDKAAPKKEVPASKPAEAAPAASTDADKGSAAKKKKGWMGGIKDAVGNMMGKGKKNSQGKGKDET